LERRVAESVISKGYGIGTAEGKKLNATPRTNYGKVISILKVGEDKREYIVARLELLRSADGERRYGTMGVYGDDNAARMRDLAGWLRKEYGIPIRLNRFSEHLLVRGADSPLRKLRDSLGDFTGALKEVKPS
jgi:hypothetical protein